MEFFFNKKSNILKLWTFRAKVFELVPLQQNWKLDTFDKIRYLIDYQSYTKDYCIYINNKLIVFINVFFHKQRKLLMSAKLPM